MTRAIFWDNDGILVDTEHLYFKATAEILAGAGVVLTEAQYVDLFLVQGRGAWHLAAERGLPETELDRLRDARNALYSRWLSEKPILIDGVRDVLEALNGKYVMGVVTSSRKDHFDAIHRRTGLLRYFDFALTSDDFTHVKPHPEPYMKAIDKTGFDPADCLAIEDSARGLTAARSAGLRCLVVPTPLTRSSDFSGADRILDDIREVLTVL